MKLKPSEIHYSQNRISAKFGESTNHAGKYIGETLDAILKGDIAITDIPRKDVYKRDGDWYSANNRRLWIFKKLEKLGVLDKIEVVRLHTKPKNLNVTAEGGGYQISFHGDQDPGGSYWLDFDPSQIQNDPVLKKTKEEDYYKDIHLPSSSSGSGSQSSLDEPPFGPSSVNVDDVENDDQPAEDTTVYTKRKTRSDETRTTPDNRTSNKRQRGHQRGSNKEQ